MASRNKDERAYVNALLKALQKNSLRVYAFVDRDSGAVRHTSSGWDFQLSRGGRIVYCEAKIEKGKLTEWQEYTRAAVLASGTPYLIVRFWDSGRCFTIDDGIKIETIEARARDFFGRE